MYALLLPVKKMVKMVFVQVEHVCCLVPVITCLSAKKGANPDVLSLQRQDGREYPIDEIRKIISEVYKKPNGPYKLVVFKDAHLLNEKCQNADYG